MFDVFYIGIKPGLFPHEKPVADIKQACAQSRTRFFWIVNYLCDYTDWDWLWEPSPWQNHQRHAWCSQWQKDSGTYLVPRLGFQDTNYHNNITIRRKADIDIWDKSAYAITDTFDFSWHPDPTDPPYIYQFGTQWQKTGGPRYVVSGATEIKYVDQLRVDIKVGDAPAIVIDHLDGAVDIVVEQISVKTNVLRSTRFVDNYLDTLRRVANSTDYDGYLWICSSICDYQDFDFTWHPEQWQASMLHVFASEDQKFGDTFYMHVPSFRNRSPDVKLLDWYDINFVEAQSVPRRPMPVIQHNYDSHVEAVTNTTWSGPLAVFTVRDFVYQPRITVPLWRNETRAVTPLDRGGSTVIMPRDAISCIKTQIYDYTWIDRKHQHRLACQPQDIVFISYDEPQADINWQRLYERFPRAHRVHGVTGMENALVIAAKCSRTPWYFAVFAKTELAEKFNFTYAPDYLQQPKHYIFDCLNEVNGLRYGHMGIVLYNVNYVLQNRTYQDLDLDYTLSFPHEIVPELSCFGRFDSSAYHTWRTAFRECAKLALYNHREQSVETEYRLQIWCTHATGKFAQWCLLGAQDGVEFFQQCNGDLSGLKQSFDWQWLRNRFVSRYGEID